MTVPHLMNCAHSDDGWCLNCVAKLHWDFETTEKALTIALDRSWDGPLAASARNQIMRIRNGPNPYDAQEGTPDA